MTGREWQFGWYARDRWQVSRNLTVNIGLRYEYYPLMTRCCGKGLERYDPSTNLLYLGGRGNVPVDAGFSVSKKLFAPRVGFAYRLGEKTVIRSGYGISYDPIPFSRPLRGFYPLTINYIYVGSQQPSTWFRRWQRYSGAEFSRSQHRHHTLPGNVTERSPWGGEIKRGYIQSWNFTIERRASRKHDRHRRLRRHSEYTHARRLRHQLRCSRLDQRKSAVSQIRANRRIG